MTKANNNYYYKVNISLLGDLIFDSIAWNYYKQANGVDCYNMENYGGEYSERYVWRIIDSNYKVFEPYIDKETGAINLVDALKFEDYDCIHAFCNDYGWEYEIDEF